MAGTAQENEAVVRRGHELFSSGNMEGLAQLFADDAVWHAGGRGRFSGEKRGREAAFAYFGQIAELSGGTFRVELHDVLANDEHTAALLTATGERNGRRLAVHEVLLFHVRDGKIVEAWEHYEDSGAYDEFFA